MKITQLEQSFVPTDHDTFILEISGYAKDNLIKKLNSVNKLKTKLKSMEIAFEMINNDRNRLIHQLSVCEVMLEDE